MAKDKGTPTKFDPSFNGPIKNRGCTDIICCLIFVICFVGMLAVGVFGFARGEPVRLLYPTDSAGNLCGIGDLANKPYLLFFDVLKCLRMAPTVIFTSCPTPQICVEKCPPDYWLSGPDAIKEKATPNDRSRRKIMYCQYGVDALTSPKSIEELVTSEDCASYLIKSSPVIGRCFPSNLNSLNLTVLKAMVVGTLNETGIDSLSRLLEVHDYGMKILQDVRASWWMILAGLTVGMLISFIWIILMRWIAGVMVWLTIVLFLLLFCFTTYFSFNKYFTMKDNPVNQGDLLAINTSLSYYTNLADTWLVLGIISAVVLAIVLLILIFLRERILIAIALIKEASRAVSSMMFTLFWPLIPFVMQIILFVFWGSSAIFLASSGKPTYGLSNNTANSTYTAANAIANEAVNTVVNMVPCDPKANSTAGEVCNFLKYGGDSYTQYLQFYQLFMLFWVMNFIIALGQITLAGAFASYYWALNKPADIPTFPVIQSLGRAIRYHLGSIAFGSLIIAIIQMIRVILEYVDAKLKGAENQVAKFILKCMKCCFWCLEKFMKFINKNAYILIAVYGENFCTSAKNAFSLIMRNIVRVVVIDKVADFLLLIGKLMVVGMVGTVAFIFFSGDAKGLIPIDSISDYVADYAPDLHYYLAPVIIIIVGTYVIASCFFSVYSMAIDTLFLCFLEDLERHDGSNEKPYYMTDGLKKLLKLKKPAPQQEMAQSTLD